MKTEFCTELEKAVYVTGYGNCVGKTEGEGPLGDKFDTVIDDGYFAEASFEKAEVKLHKRALERALERARITVNDLDIIGAGDLLNQCVASAYAVRESNVPFVGLYGACSTMALSLGMCSMALESGFARRGAAVTSSHFGSAERQFRYPLEYGGQRPPSAQRTVTGAGAVILSTCESADIRISAVRFGRVVDFGITDINNMGGAMAPAAADTLLNYLAHGRDADLIATGDLASIGSEILYDLMAQEGVDIRSKHVDCGKMIFDADAQDVHAGGSGCGCSAAVLTAELLPRLERGEINSMLFVATGALMSPLTVQQKESIPGIAHLIRFERVEAK